MRTAPYGTWVSPIRAADVAAAEALVEYVGFNGDEVWWVETRPEEGGRAVLVRQEVDGRVREALPPGWDVRTRVIEYGGRPWLSLGESGADGVVFTHWADQRVYRARPGSAPTPISPRPERPAGERFCDFARVGEYVWALRETITGDEPSDVKREIVALPLDGTAADDPSEARVMARSHHFMTGPKISSDGRHVAWIGWDHPRMPWDATDLMCADIDGASGLVGSPTRIAGGGAVEAIGQVEWAPDQPDVLYLLSDPDGWWNVHELVLDGGSRNLCPRPEEFGEALWRIGARWFLPLGGGRFFVVHGTCARRLAVLEADGALLDIGDPFTEWAALATDGRRVAGTAASLRHRRTVVLVDPDEPCAEVVRPAPVAARAYLPPGRHQSFRGDQGEEVHAFVYPPFNPDHEAPAGELPPFLVHVHGGPTSRSQLVANQEIAFFTSRGIGVVDVQYGGSTGWGRDYRERLRGNWGVVDVADCATAVRGLIAAGLADPDRIGIRGGSAGGWTTVASLSAEPDLYRAGGVYFPLLDPVEWRVRGTHDFESRYLDGLIGPWPHAEKRYGQVSPLLRADLIRAPFAVFQGLDDAVCPPRQAELLLAKMHGGGVPHAYFAFEGEQHGFRRAETVVACLDAELALYAGAFRFSRPDLTPLEMHT